VARFIGSPPMNTVDGRVRVDGGRALVELGDGHLDVGPRTGVADGDAVVVGIRPEHLRIAEHGVAAHVRAIEWLGHERHVYCDLAGAPVIVRDTDPGEDHAEPGAEVKVQADAERVHLFDPATTERID
jgi:ABC-type sugar transport system ATPase subunit